MVGNGPIVVAVVSLPHARTLLNMSLSGIMESLIKIKKLNPQASFYKGSEDAIGYDLTCVDVGYKDGVGRLHLGIAVEPPPGMWFMCAPRSSFPKSGWIQANSIGIIDPD